MSNSAERERHFRVSPDLIAKGLTLMEVWHYNPNLFPSLLKVIQKSSLLDLLVSRTLPMSKIQQAMGISASQQSAKIILHPWKRPTNQDQRLNILLIISDDMQFSPLIFAPKPFDRWYGSPHSCLGVHHKTDSHT